MLPYPLPILSKFHSLNVIGKLMFARYVAAFLVIVSITAFALLYKNASETKAETNPPIVSEVLFLPVPNEFKLAFENKKDDVYIKEWVLEKETVNQWSQMITMMVFKNFASNPDSTPEKMVIRTAAGFKQACPNTFNVLRLGETKLSGYDAFGAIISCGETPIDITHSETVFLIVIKGKKDYYNIQWAERSTASTSPIKLDERKWSDRIERFSKVKLCAITQSQSVPSPDCLATVLP
jgi:hypothetical protein